jgi:hypothetical protein
MHEQPPSLELGGVLLLSTGADNPTLAIECDWL